MKYLPFTEQEKLSLLRAFITQSILRVSIGNVAYSCISSCETFCTRLCLWKKKTNQNPNMLASKRHISDWNISKSLTCPRIEQAPTLWASWKMRLSKLEMNSHLSGQLRAGQPTFYVALKYYWITAFTNRSRSQHISQHIPVSCIAKPKKIHWNALKFKMHRNCACSLDTCPGKHCGTRCRLFTCRGETQYFWPLLLQVNLYLKILKIHGEHAGSR